MSALDDFDPDEAKIADQERRFYDCGVCDGAHREDDCPYAVVDGSGTAQGAKDEASRELAQSPSNNKDLKAILVNFRIKHMDGFFGNGKPKDAERILNDTKAAIEAQYISKAKVLKAIPEKKLISTVPDPGNLPEATDWLKGYAIGETGGYNQCIDDFKDALGLNNPSKDSNNG